MNSYVTGMTIKTLREKAGLTQAQLGEMISVSDKAVSRWETGKGYPDITLIEPLSKALGVSVSELFEGERIENKNISFNLKRLRIYVCPACGNVMVSGGDAHLSCCGITLCPEESEIPDGSHVIKAEPMEDEYYITSDHPMEKDHFISFVLAVTDQSWELIKLYPEGPMEARLKMRRLQTVYYFCNRHGLFKTVIKKQNRP